MNYTYSLEMCFILFLKGHVKTKILNKNLEGITI